MVNSKWHGGKEEENGEGTSEEADTATKYTETRGVEYTVIAPLLQFAEVCRTSLGLLSYESLVEVGYIGGHVWLSQKKDFTGKKAPPVNERRRWLSITCP
jgi:hypothetical protein